MSNNYRFCFVGGCPRSGTTLLKDMLHSHPEVVAGPEFDFLPEIMNLYSKMERSVQSKRIDKYLDDGALKYSFSSFVNQLLIGITGHKPGASLIVEKTPSNVLAFSRIAEVMPAAKFICVVRDGRDVLCSMKEVRAKYVVQKKEPPDFIATNKKSILTWRRYVEAGNIFANTFGAEQPDRLLLLRYEDIVNAPGRASQQIASFLNLELSELRLNPLSGNSVQCDTKHTREWQTNKHGSSVDRSGVGRWINELRYVEKRYFRYLAGDLLVKHGYEPSMNWVH